MTDISLEVNRKLDSILLLLAGAAAQRIADAGGKQKDQILTLSRANLDPATIAKVLATTRNTVSVAISKHTAATKRSAARANGG